MYKKKWFIYYQYEDEDSVLKEITSPFFQTKKEAVQYLYEIAKEKTITKSLLLTEGKDGVIKRRSEQNYFFFYLICIGVFLSILLKVFA